MPPNAQAPAEAPATTLGAGAHPSTNMHAPAVSPTAPIGAAPAPKPGGNRAITIIAVALVVVAVIAVVLVVAVGTGAFSAFGHKTESGPLKTSDTGVSAAAPEQHGDEATPIEYTFSYQSIDDEGQYTYAVIESSTPNDNVERVNAEIKQNAQRAYDNRPPSTDRANWRGMYNTSWTTTVTYFRKGIVGIQTESYQDAGGAHGQAVSDARVYNLNTGESMSAWEFAGLSSTDRDAMTRRLVEDYYRKTGGSDIYKGVTDALGSGSLDTRLGNKEIVYYLGDDGVYAWFGPYVLGSFAYGTRCLLMCSDEGGYIGGLDKKMSTIPEGSTMTGAPS